MGLRNLFQLRKGKPVVYQSPDDCKWYWRHVARNGKIDDASEQGYASSSYARYKAEQVFPRAKGTVLPPVCPPPKK